MSSDEELKHYERSNIEEKNGAGEHPESAQLAEMWAIHAKVASTMALHRATWQADHPGEIFDAVRPGTRGRSTDLDEDERQRLQLEALASRAEKKPWQDRGPLQEESAPGFWRGQALRQGTQGGKRRYGNRGGSSKEYFAEKARRSEGHNDG